MRIGVLSATTPDITGTIVSGGNQDTGIIPGTQLSGGATSGPTVSGDTLVCPPGYPYDYNIHDCSKYSGSPVDTAQLTLQASIDVCTSGGGTWDSVNNVCVPSTPAASQAPAANQLISGIDNTVLYAAGGLLLLMIFMGARR